MVVTPFIEKLKEKREQSEIETFGRVLSDDERDQMMNDRANRNSSVTNTCYTNSISEKFLSSVPKRYINSTFSNYLCDTDKQKAIVAYLKQGKSAIIYGSNGTGKTHLAYACCFHQISQNKTAKYILAFDFFNEIRDSFDTHTSNDIVMQYAKYDYLVIDEVDKTQGTAMEFAYLYSLINRRYNDIKPTVLVTNSKPDELKVIVGASVIDRIGSDGKIIELSGENYRQKIAKEQN